MSNYGRQVWNCEPGVLGGMLQKTFEQLQSCNWNEKHKNEMQLQRLLVSQTVSLVVGSICVQNYGQSKWSEEYSRGIWVPEWYEGRANLELEQVEVHAEK